MGIPDSNHAGDPISGVLVHIHSGQVAVLILGMDHAVLHLQLLGLLLGRSLAEVFFLRAELCRVVHLSLDLLHGIANLIAQGTPVRKRIIGQFIGRIQTTGQLRFTQHHFRMRSEILIDISTIPTGIGYAFPVGIFKGFTCILRSVCSLFQDQDIRHNLGTGIAGKGRVRQTNGTQQVSSLHDVLPDRIIFAIHGIAGCNKHHNTAGSHLVQCLGKEVIMDRAGDCLGIVLVGHAVLTERNVTDCHIHVSVRDIGFLKALDTHICVGIQVLGKQAGNMVQLHHGPALYLCAHIGRHRSHEVTNAGGRLQHSAAGKAQLLQAVIHGLDNLNAGIVGVLGTFSGRLVFFLGKYAPKFFKLSFQTLHSFILDLPGLPVGYRLTKSICQATPAHILGENLLFGAGGNPALGSDLFHQLDRLDIGSGPRLGTAGQVQAVPDHKVASLGILGGLLFDLPLHFLMQFVPDMIVGHIFAYGL